MLDRVRLSPGTASMVGKKIVESIFCGEHLVRSTRLGSFLGWDSIKEGAGNDSSNVRAGARADPERVGTLALVWDRWDGTSVFLCVTVFQI